MKKHVTILGAGVMGSALAVPLSDSGFDVTLVGTPLDDNIIASIQKDHFHPGLKVTLPQSVLTLHDSAYTGSGVCDLIVLGVSSAGIGWAIEKLSATLRKPTPILMITKGLSSQLEPLPDVMVAALKARLGFSVSIAAIAGPCIAGELAVRRPTGTVIVSRDFALALKLCGELQTNYYHPKPSIDMIGVEFCAAFKNFFAIAVGFALGQQEVLPQTENKAFNHNAAALLFDQAIREMMVLVRAFGGSPESVWGLAGAGDLYVTCQAGRNSRLGAYLGRGLSYLEAKAGPMQFDTVEGAELGIAVARAVRANVLSKRLDSAQLPLTIALLKTLTEAKPFAPEWAQF